MLMLVMIPPALVQAPPPVPKPWGAMAETLGGIAEAYVVGREADLPALVWNARRLWEHSRKHHTVSLSEQDLQSIDKGLEGMGSLKPRYQAESALAMAAMMSARMRPGQSKERLDADLATMLAWCRVESRTWDQVPNVAEAFKPLLEHNPARHPGDVAQIRGFLQQFQDDLGRKSVSAAKKDLRRLLELVDALEK